VEEERRQGREGEREEWEWKGWNGRIGLDSALAPYVAVDQTL